MDARNSNENSRDHLLGSPEMESERGKNYDSDDDIDKNEIMEPYDLYEQTFTISTETDMTFFKR